MAHFTPNSLINVTSRRADPPVGPSIGAYYLAIAPASGAWINQENTMPYWNGAMWDFYDPTAKLSIYVTTESAYYVYMNGSWTPKNQPESLANVGNAEYVVLSPDAALPGSTFYNSLLNNIIGGHNDRVVTIGFNLSQITPQDQNYAAVGLSIESSGGAADTEQPELHVLFGSKDTTKQVRAISMSATCTNAGQCDANIILSAGVLEVRKNDGTTVLGYLSEDSLRWVQGFTCNNYQATALAAGNKAGNAYLQLLRLSDGALGLDNSLIIGEGVPATAIIEMHRPTFIWSQLASTQWCLEVGGNNGGVHFFVDSVDPNGSFSAQPGDMFYRVAAGAASGPYTNVSAANPGTTWQKVLSMPAAGPLDISAIAAGSPNMKVTATSDTPATTYTAHVPSTDPAGFIEILVGANTRYIPFYT